MSKRNRLRLIVIAAILSASCGDNSALEPIPVDLCFEPPKVPKIHVWFEFSSDGWPDRAAMSLADYEPLRRYVDASVIWARCVESIK
jgi:hypothetical protein